MPLSIQTPSCTIQNSVSWISESYSTTYTLHILTKHYCTSNETIHSCNSKSLGLSQKIKSVTLHWQIQSPWAFHAKSKVWQHSGKFKGLRTLTRSQSDKFKVLGPFVQNLKCDATVTIRNLWVSHTEDEVWCYRGKFKAIGSFPQNQKIWGYNGNILILQGSSYLAPNTDYKSYSNLKKYPKISRFWQIVMILNIDAGFIHCKSLELALSSQ